MSSAQNGIDFAFLPGTDASKNIGSVTFAIGQEYIDIPITVLDDSIIEDTQTAQIVLLPNETSYQLGDIFEAIVTIADNDRPTNVRVETIQHGIEGEQDIFIRLHRDQTDKPLTITFEYDKNASTAILATDFEAFAGMLFINCV
ncbi:MAG: hypothetical protein LBE12_02360 [Planctomycetaceae bacterium]|nr:hypothetical protein [Planctomycetaceae bacterium]